MSSEGIKEKIKYQTEKLKLITAVILIITSGLVGLLFKETEIILKLILFISGTITDVIFLIYLLKLNNSIEELLINLES